MIPMVVEFGSGSGKTEGGPLIVPGERQTRVLKQLLCCQIARLPPVEDRVGDIRREIAEADKTSEIGRAHAFALGKCSKANVVAADEARVKPVRLEEQLDQSRVRFRRSK